MSKNVTVVGVEPNPPDALRNPSLNWRTKFWSSQLGDFYLPFERRADAEACAEHVRANGMLPLMNKHGQIIPTERWTTERWVCEREYAPVRHFYIGRDSTNTPKCACGANYRIPACPQCGQRTPQDHGPCADCANDAQACSH